MKITDLFTNNVFLAPLAGFTDAGFRALAKKYGCALTFTEMVSAKSLEMGNPLSKELLFSAESAPRAVQLFGHEPKVFEKVAQCAELEKFDIIDINMGCPMKKIIGNGDGSALMQNPKLAAEIIKAVKKSGKFVSVKFRTGITDDSLAVPFARACQDGGADMLTVHGRTQKQLYSGKADWTAIGKVVSAVSIPVIANGDVVDKASFDAVLAQTGAWGAAVGRGSLGKPYIFSEILGKAYKFDMLADVKTHIDILLQYLPERIVVNEMKKHICYYAKGIRGNRVLAGKICTAKSLDEMTSLLADFLNGIIN